MRQNGVVASCLAASCGLFLQACRLTGGEHRTDPPAHDATRGDGQEAQGSQAGAPAFVPALREHRTNYFAVSHNASFDGSGAVSPGNDAYVDEEAVFQVSVRHDLKSWRPTPASRIDLALAFTTKSFWQVFTSSAPFRTTDYEPEAFADWFPETLRSDGQETGIRLGLVHQSNGESGIQSRGWDRVYSEIMMRSPGWTNPGSHENEWSVSVKPWLILQEGRGNEDIDRYLGDFELEAGITWNDRDHKLLLMERNALWEGDWRNSAQLEYSYGRREWHGFRWYAQVFHGYGENLLDYDDSAMRFVVGFELAATVAQD